MQREIIKPQFGTPLVIKLDFGPEGVEKPSQITGEMQYMYTVDDDARLIFLPEQARNAIVRSGAQAGDTVALLKSKRGKDTLFTAQLVSDAAEFEGAPEPPPPPARERLAPKTGTAAARLPQRVYHQPETHQAGAAAHRPIPEPQAEVTPALDASAPISMSKLLCLAVDAIAIAQKHARAQGLSTIEFTSEDVRAIALSVYIGAQRKGGRS